MAPLDRPQTKRSEKVEHAVPSRQVATVDDEDAGWVGNGSHPPRIGGRTFDR